MWLGLSRTLTLRRSEWNSNLCMDRTSGLLVLTKALVFCPRVYSFWFVRYARYVVNIDDHVIPDPSMRPRSANAWFTRARYGTLRGQGERGQGERL
jgi:hypothetical protein